MFFWAEGERSSYFWDLRFKTFLKMFLNYDFDDLEIILEQELLFFKNRDGVMQ